MPVHLRWQRLRHPRQRHNRYSYIYASYRSHYRYFSTPATASSSSAISVRLPGSGIQLDVWQRVTKSHHWASAVTIPAAVATTPTRRSHTMELPSRVLSSPTFPQLCAVFFRSRPLGRQVMFSSNFHSEAITYVAGTLVSINITASRIIYSSYVRRGRFNVYTEVNFIYLCSFPELLRQEMHQLEERQCLKGKGMRPRNDLFLCRHRNGRVALPSQSHSL